MTISDQNSLVRHIWRIIDNDEYAWICVWGPPRTGKSSLCLLLSYYVYKDWQDVLNSIVFNLQGVLHKLTEGLPRTFPTRSGLNMRVPLLFVDDFGANCNKAKTQYDKGWDLFKGAFDTLGTVVGVLLANMVKPNEATQQLTEKYTHEVWVYSRGKAKFDTVHQEQDFSNWNSRQKKRWIASITFPEVPKWVYKEYNTMRVQLAKEALFNIKETISMNEVDIVLKRIQKSDKLLIHGIYNKGAMSKTKLQKELKIENVDDTLMRCKAKGLVLSERVTRGNYRYNLTTLGYDVLDKLKAQ